MRSLLTIDIGNTAMKAAVYRDEDLDNCIVCRGASYEPIETLLDLCSVDGVAICSVSANHDDIIARLRESGYPLLELREDTPLPIAMDYDRSTLGMDRVAAACGVADPHKDVLVVDAGTAVTLDMVAHARFVGGNISPGLRLRFRSLHEFTSRLPLVGPEGDAPMFGHDTQTAIRSGVLHGLANEIESYYLRSLDIYPDLQMVLTGGDAALLEPLLRPRCRHMLTDSQTVGRGLVRIYNYNYEL